MSMKRLAQKKKCIQHRALIVAWLRVNYCLRESGSIAKRDVFVHYIELCQANKIQPSSAASFGKILKMAFPTVKCNRVGPRGASKHHYRGLVLRDSYHLSLAGVQPISEAAISEMMRHLEEEEGRAASNKAAGRRSRESDEEEDDESDEKDDVDSDEGHASRVQVPSHYGAGVKREAHHQHLQPFASSQQLHHSTSPNELQPLSSSSVPSSPGAHRRGGGHGPYGGGGSSPPAANGYAAASSLYPGAGYAAAPQLHQQQPQQPQQHADEYRAPAFVLPPPGYSYAPYNNLLQQQQLQQQQQQHPQTAATARFSWVSPEMDAARGGGVFPVLPLPGQQQQQQQLPGHADKEWMEKRELVSFCERTFESLYDTILRTNCGPSKDQVLTYIVDAWKNLQDYTRQHMSLLPPSAVAAAAAGGSPQHQAAMQQAQQQQHHHQLPSQQPPRYHELDDELKRKAVLDSYHNNNVPSLAQFHQPLVEHMQQDGMRSTSPVSPPSSSSSSAATSAAVTASSTAPSSSSATTEENSHSHSTNSDTNLGHLGLLMPPPSGFSFTGSSSALSLSWLNSMVATSMQNVAAAAQAHQQRPPALHSPTLAHSPLNSNNGNNNGNGIINSGPGGGYGLPFADLVGKRGSLEGLDYRSFEWKGAF